MSVRVLGQVPTMEIYLMAGALVRTYPGGALGEELARIPLVALSSKAADGRSRNQQLKHGSSRSHGWTSVGYP